jgi:hypothetical protein
MSVKEWDMLSEEHQRELISKGRTPASLPQSSPTSNTAPVEIHSPKAKELLARLAEAKEHTYALQQLWISLELCECAPDRFQFNIWYVQRHTFETIMAAFQAVAIMLSKLRAEKPEEAATKTHMDKI